MQKVRLNITLDKDLIDYAKIYAQEQRESVSEIFTQFILNLKRTKENDLAEIILSDISWTEEHSRFTALFERLAIDMLLACLNQMKAMEL